MKQNNAPKKLQLTKIKVANLTATKGTGKICVTSIANTSCPGCRETLVC
ncbi:hypothetical protein CLV59_11010 [Chitinophaga dinghuensis]|uniref:Uncharacterized protein n=1 Tax=Chitinophaga dinghuensis TaxID=1539050 RepID=A0A327VJS3_9BACT|nr:hypothetical protein [Chitinophaga dinghuensis]RAJ74964.1 hypothetical protein CLV59_11010 [Chitinophaga dinghuensis]